MQTHIAPMGAPLFAFHMSFRASSSHACNRDQPFIMTALCRDNILQLGERGNTIVGHVSLMFLHITLRYTDFASVWTALQLQVTFDIKPINCPRFLMLETLHGLLHNLTTVDVL